mmetsp:Transcript_41774/g.79797  ORF Transcript_41774/g.79797 Transcript_41774/m.79797 type:complete len:284 (-) Transcript_41774:526-1377(-)
MLPSAEAIVSKLSTAAISSGSWTTSVSATVSTEGGSSTPLAARRSRVLYFVEGVAFWEAPNSHSHTALTEIISQVVTAATMPTSWKPALSEATAAPPVSGAPRSRTSASLADCADPVRSPSKPVISCQIKDHAPARTGNATRTRRKPDLDHAAAWVITSTVELSVGFAVGAATPKPPLELPATIIGEFSLDVSCFDSDTGGAVSRWAVLPGVTTTCWPTFMLSGPELAMDGFKAMMSANPILYLLAMARRFSPRCTVCSMSGSGWALKRENTPILLPLCRCAS